MEITYSPERRRFEAVSTFAEKDALKAAGFRWDKDRRQWYTPRAETAARFAHAATAETRAELQRIADQQIASLAASRATDAAIAVPVPDGLALLPYQRAGIAFALDRPAVLFADEMGLGKTIEAIGVINADLTLRRILIVCPATLRINWERELTKWLTRALTIGLATSTAWPDTDIVIINYDILHKHTTAITRGFDLAIIDEAHYAKNAKARRSKMVYAIAARRRILMTGTPIVNRPAELFPLLQYLDPATWTKFWPYAMRYCGAYHNGWGWDFSGASNLAELQTKLRATIMVRRLKADVLTELPAKRRQIIELPQNGAREIIAREQREWSRVQDTLAALRAAVDRAREAGDPETYRAAVEALRDGERAAFDAMARLRHDTAVAKVPYVIEHVRDALDSGAKVVLFAHHHDVIDALAREFAAVAVVVDGRVSKDARQVAVDRFQTDETVRLFIGGITAAGVGITLTAAAHVIFAELDWVPGNMTQAEDRCHRIGQRESVLVQHLVLEGSLDAHMARTIVAKQDVADDALDVQPVAPVGVVVLSPAPPPTAPVDVPVPAPVTLGRVHADPDRLPF